MPFVRIWSLFPSSLPLVSTPLSHISQSPGFKYGTRMHSAVTTATACEQAAPINFICVLMYKVQDRGVPIFSDCDDHEV